MPASRVGPGQAGIQIFHVRLARRSPRPASPRSGGDRPRRRPRGPSRRWILPTSRATCCHSRGSQPSAAATSVVSWRRCTNAGRCSSPRLPRARGRDRRTRACRRGVAEDALRDRRRCRSRTPRCGSRRRRTSGRCDAPIGTHADASGRSGRITRQRWNIVDQSSSVRVTPPRLVSWQVRVGVLRHGRKGSGAGFPVCERQGQAKPMALSIAAGMSESRPSASSAARSTLIASRVALEPRVPRPGRDRRRSPSASTQARR